MVLNLLMNFLDKLLIKVVFMILKNSYLCKSQTVYLLLHVLHQEVVETKSVQDYLGILT